MGLGRPSKTGGEARGAQLVAARADAHSVDGANPRVSEACGRLLVACVRAGHVALSSGFVRKERVEARTEL